MRTLEFKIIARYTGFLILVCLLAGCENALYFYETDKVSLTVEARPDSSQPVQGSLGIKERTVLIAPRKDENQDAVSAISSFNFKIIPEAGTIFNPVLLQTAFITGDAASELTPDKAQGAAKAIALSGINISSEEKLANDIVNESTPDQKNILKEITGRDFNSLTEQDWKNISEITSLDKTVYNKALHEALRAKLAE
ncbi:MAG: hypothetical protein IPN42_03055 [Methylococcaceae bacterium]|nr:hypothetical protein [Methylococcaceae bacterium]